MLQFFEIITIAKKSVSPKKCIYLFLIIWLWLCCDCVVVLFRDLLLWFTVYVTYNYTILCIYGTYTEKLYLRVQLIMYFQLDNNYLHSCILNRIAVNDDIPEYLHTINLYKCYIKTIIYIIHRSTTFTLNHVPVSVHEHHHYINT